MTYRIGIDAGSKTIKVVVLNESGAVERATYRRHRADIKTTLAEVVHDLVWRYGDVSGSVAVTGSAGIELAEMLDVPFVQEVVATTHAVQREFPEADAIIELGGEDAKVVYLAGGLEQRMNATCAGGTGGFIDTIAFMLGTSSKEMSSLAMGATKTYPIASRCAVFAQTDVRPLLNAGAKKSDIAASALDAVVKQTLGGLACGRPIKGTTVFLGGPLEHIPSLVHRFRRALGLDHRTGIKPTDAHLFTAKGAALLSDDPVRLDAPVSQISLTELEGALETLRGTQDDLPRLSPLFSDEAEHEAFKKRHAVDKVARKRLGDAAGPVYLGIDAGSTAVKLALIDEEGCLLHSDYQPVAGNVIATASEMLLDLYRAMPREYDGTPLCTISHATVTGYGESLLMAAFGIDSGVVETTAHLRAARKMRPDADFVLDIGGQDMKALWVERGAISKAVLNEACSSGCGSFIEGSAHSLRCTVHAFASLALKASQPVDLGTKCTVFMTSRVRHAQKIGVPTSDISAGIAYSVVNNALFKVIGLDNLDSLGEAIVVQGGAFLSDAVLRAFELVSGKQVVRPDIAHLMGAYGAALVARSRAASGESSLLGSGDVAALKPRYRTETCPGCTNACSLSIVTFEADLQARRTALGKRAKGYGEPNGDALPRGERCFVDGNRCERAYAFFEHAQGRVGNRIDATGAAPNIMALEQGLLARYRDSLPPDAGETTGDGSPNPQPGRTDVARGNASPPCADTNREAEEAGAAASGSDRRGIVIGLPCTLNDYEALPFWHTLITRLGFSVIVGCNHSLDEGGFDTIPSESVCYPAKITHQRLFSLAERGANAIFMPEYERSSHCPVSSLYARAVRDSMPTLREGSMPLASPKLACLKPGRIAADEGDRSSLFEALQSLDASGRAFTEAEFGRAIEAAAAEQERFYATLERASEKALAWIEAKQGHGIVLAGRPYHVDSALSHGIDAMLSSLGFAVLSPAGLGSLTRKKRPAAGPTRKPLASQALWRQGKRFDRLAALVASRDDLDMVCLQAFGCSYDAVSLIDVKHDLEEGDHPFTALKIDEIADTAHILIRLRTLADTIEERRSCARKEETAPESQPANRSAEADSTQTAFREPTAEDSLPRDEAAFPVASIERARTIELGSIEAEDVELGRREINQDVCSTVAAVAGRIVRLCRTDPSIGTVIVPEGCISCLFDALPDLVRNPLGYAPRIVLRRKSGLSWKSGGTTACRASDDSTQPEPLASDGSSQLTPSAPGGSTGPARIPRIGVLGNPFMVFEPPMNDDLAGLIESLGCEAVMPDADNLLVDDVRYLEQMASFEKEKVNHVVYAQSFGCLKGHIESRGALHGLKKRFPAPPITVIDYDPDASALNRKNRILLVVEAARNALAE